MSEIHQGQTGNDGPSPSGPPTKSPWLVLAGLVVAAIVVVLWNVDRSHCYAMATFDNLGGDFGLQLAAPGSPWPRRLTESQRLLLEGDTTRATRHEQQRAIWEAHPTNRVYLGNYITALQAADAESIPLDQFRKELAAARELDPENARYDYLEAARLLKTAAVIHSDKAAQDGEGKEKTHYRLEVLHRDQLDEAMVILRRGLGKPYWRRYSADMLKEQLAVLGPPQRLVQLLQRTAIAAGTLLPDLAPSKSLARSSRLYAELLIAESRSAEAVPFLDAWKPLAQHLTEDSFTLIDVLVGAAVVNEAAQTIPPIYRALGRVADAERTEAEAAAIAKPVNDWRAQRDLVRKGTPPATTEQQNTRLLEERAGILASMLLPALGTWPEAQAYEPGRMTEYVVFTEVVVAAILVGLLLTLLVSQLLAWRWRMFRPANEPPPPRLMPDAGTLVRILILGVILPLVVFFVVTRCLPWSGQAYSVRVGAPKLLAEFGLLVMALVTLPILMTIAQVQRRCSALNMNVARWHARHVSWACSLVGALVLLVAWCWPAAPGESIRNLAFVGLGFLAVALVVAVLLGIAQGMGGQRQHGAFYGSVFRTLVPVLALTIIVLGVITRPVLLRAETSYIQRDTLLQDRDRVGFTRLENDLVQELRTAMLAVFR